MSMTIRNRKSAFTLIELLVVVAIIALLISILLPTLARAREQTRSVKCLANLKTLGQGVLVFTAENKDKLPGPLHPALYKNQGIDALLEDQVRPTSVAGAKFSQSRQLTYVLRKVFNDSTGFKDSTTDQVATCPVMEGINPDENFDSFVALTGKPAYPTHYVLHNIGEFGNEGGGGSEYRPRITDPPYYFGLSPWSGASPEVLSAAAKHRPLPSAKLPKPSEEWMIADAWYRPNSCPISQQLQQEGPYQYGWTGESLPYFAPHFQPDRLSYSFSNTNDRRAQSDKHADGKRDGETNTVFFDGHALGVKSKTFFAYGYELAYGFPGTVNPRFANPQAEQFYYTGCWR